MFNDNVKFLKIYLILFLISIAEIIVYTFFVDDLMYFTFNVLPSDPGRDFYTSIFYSRDLNPYVHKTFPYSALYVVFMYMIQYFFHIDNDFIENEEELIINNYGNIFILKNINFYVSMFVILFLVFLITDYLMKKIKINFYLSFFLSISFVLNIGFLCAILRGNYLSISILFTLFF